MLPLWIIDITKKSDRRDEFIRLAEKIDHVFISENLKISQSQKSKEPEKAQVSNSADSKDMQGPNADASEFLQQKVSDGEPVQKKTLKERQEEEDRERAKRDSYIYGNYWYYSQFENIFDKELPTEPKDYQKLLEDFLEQERAKSAEKDSNTSEKSSADPEDQPIVLDEKEKETYLEAMKLYYFQEEMVKEGARFIHEIRQSNAKPYQTINIVVLGDATEEFTRNVFPSIAAILQKEKGRFLPSHIHQGMSVVGALYVPCDINTYEVRERQKILHTLDEIEVQHNITAIRGYDYMMLYQNVQNRTECTYHLLDLKEQAQYLIQCLVHMYLACDINHPLISGTSSEDTFYFSMGAASLYFDMQYEDENDANMVAQNIVINFEKDGDDERIKEIEHLLDTRLYEARLFIDNLGKLTQIDVEGVEEKEFNPHPIKDYIVYKLKRLYYQYQLRYFPAELLRRIIAEIEEKTSTTLDKISSLTTNAYRAAAISVLPAITRRIKKLTENDGGLSFITYLIKDMQELMSKEKERLPEVLESAFWYPLIYEKTGGIPKDQKQHVEEYHDVYLQDNRSKNGGAGCAGVKEETLKKLKNLLSKEKTTLATLGRGLLAGIICVLSILPILDLMSPHVIDLGDVKKNSFYWGTAVFLIPLVIQWVSYLLYLRKKEAFIRRLKAYYTHDAYARIANRIEFEGYEFYDKMIKLGEEYLKRCERIRKEVRFEVPIPYRKMAFAPSKFNQPLNGGLFNQQVIIPETEIEGSRIKVNYQPRVVRELTRAQYYLLINRFNDELALLFQDVDVSEGHERRFDEEQGVYVFIDKDEILRNKENKWKENKDNFHNLLLKGIKSEMLPREYPTVGDKLLQYQRKIDRSDLLEPVMFFAASNGEITSHADTEFADIKINKDIIDLSKPYLPLNTTRTQVGNYNELFEKYVFITRWRCFEHFSYNRILPDEDFDMKIREKRIYEDEVKAQQKKKREEQQRNTGKEVTEEVKLKEDTEYVRCRSSLILWAVCPDDQSSEWLKLFDPNHFGEAYKERNKFRAVLNQND